MINNELRLHKSDLNGVNKIRRGIATVLESQHIFTGNSLFRDYASLIPIINNTTVLTTVKLSQTMARGDKCTTTIAPNSGTAIGPSTIDAAPNVAPTGSGIRCAMSKDGKYLAVTHAGTSTPAYLVTYKWNAGNNRYEKTNNPDVAPSSVCRNVAISRYGDYLAVEYGGASNPAYLITYKWSVTNLRYEKTANVDVAPTSNNFEIVMDYDGINLAIVMDDLSSINYYLWSVANNRYEKQLASPSETFDAYILNELSLRTSDMTFNGTYKAETNAGVDELPRLVTYLWNETTEVYDVLPVPLDMPSGVTMDVSMSMDGRHMAVVHQGATGIPYLVTYTNLLNEGYAVAPLVDSASIGATVDNIGFLLQGGIIDDFVPMVVLWTKTA